MNIVIELPFLIFWPFIILNLEFYYQISQPIDMFSFINSFQMHMVKPVFFPNFEIAGHLLIIR